MDRRRCPKASRTVGIASTLATTRPQVHGLTVGDACKQTPPFVAVEAVPHSAGGEPSGSERALGLGVRRRGRARMCPIVDLYHIPSAHRGSLGGRPSFTRHFRHSTASFELQACFASLQKAPKGGTFGIRAKCHRSGSGPSASSSGLGVSGGGAPLMSRTYSPNRFTRAVPYGLSRATCAGVTAHPSSTSAASASVRSATF